jgi:hypothetical protein
MFRVNYRRPESLPSHQRDFPPREPPVELQGRGDDGSWQLALMVGAYLVAMCVGLALLVRVIPDAVPNTDTAEILAGH